MTNTHTFKDKFKMGIIDGDTIYLSAPYWVCGWYWSFGYLGNYNCHYPIDGINKDKNLFDALREHFGDSLTIKEDSDLWTFCELVKTCYSLKETAEVLELGGSHYTKNPVSGLIQNKEEVKRINEIVIPAIFSQIEVILSKYR